MPAMEQNALVTRAKQVLFDAMLQGEMDTLVEAVHRVLGWPIVVGDHLAGAIYQVPNEKVGILNFDQLLETKRANADKYSAYQRQYLNVNSTYTDRGDVVLDRDSGGRVRKLVCNLLTKNAGSISVVAHPLDGRVSAEQLEVFKLFCKAVMLLHSRELPEEHAPVNWLVGTVRSILSRQEDAALGSAAIEELGEELAGGYRISVALAEQDAASEWISRYICDNFVRMGRNVVALPFENNTVLLCGGVSGESDAYPEEIRRAAELCRANQIPLGISARFESLNALYAHYQQALMTVRLGAMKCPERQTYDFEDMAPFQIFLPAMEDYPVDAFLLPVVRRVMDWDRKHQTEYLKTVRAYLFACRNNKRTAQNLSIHHNTLLYRLGKIKSLFDLDLAETDQVPALVCNLLWLEVKEPERFR